MIFFHVSSILRQIKPWILYYVGIVMKRKRFRHILAVVVTAGAAFFLGTVVGRRRALRPTPAAEQRIAPAGTDFHFIRSLPYLSSGTKAAGSVETGVVLHNPEKVFPGVNLYTSGHADEAYLIDMEGSLIKKWSYPRNKLEPDRKVGRGRGALSGIRFAHAFENLDLLAIYDYQGLVKLDKDSREIWTYRGEAHHDLWITPDNDIYLLTAREVPIPRLNRKTTILVDYVTVLDEGGKEKASYSILEMLEESPFSFLLPIVNHIQETEALDILHANSIQVFDGSQVARSKRLFQEGNILFSLRNLSFVFIYDPRNQEIVWGWGPTNIAFQHKARLLDNGNIIIFNNGMESSAVVEIDPLSGEVIWEYRGEGEDGFLTRLLGSAQRLPNGNTLVVDSNSGTAFELTPGKEIVWRFVNPAEADGAIAVIPEMRRYEKGAFPTIP